MIDGACFCRRRSSGGRVGAIAAPVQFPLQALNRGIEFAGSNGSRVRGPISRGHELRNLFSPLLHRCQFFFGLAKLRNREWIPILHQSQSLPTYGVQGKLLRAWMGLSTERRSFS